MSELSAPLAAYLRFKSTAIPPKLKEIAIMLTARFWGGQYVWYSHRQQALDAGLSAAFIGAMAAGERPANMTPEEAIVLDFCQELLTTRQVKATPSRRWPVASASAALIERLIGLMGQYHTTTMLFAVDRFHPLRGRQKREIAAPR
jgi:4-carboxymuconolactone decarboxylase